MAVDIKGRDTAREWHERAKCTFITLIDSEGALTRQYNFRFVPNAFFYDENGVILAKQVLFWIDNPSHRELLNRFVDGTLPPVDRVEIDETVPEIPSEPKVFSEAEQKQYDKWIESGARFEAEGRILEAAGEWRKALAMDPANYALRCQIWGLEYPERFYPEIDLKWQDEQLQRELAGEGILKCSGDGCPI